MTSKRPRNWWEDEDLYEEYVQEKAALTKSFRDRFELERSLSDRIAAPNSDDGDGM